MLLCRLVWVRGVRALAHGVSQAKEVVVTVKPWELCRLSGGEWRELLPTVRLSRLN